MNVAHITFRGGNAEEMRKLNQSSSVALEMRGFDRVEYVGGAVRFIWVAENGGIKEAVAYPLDLITEVVETVE